MWIAILILLGLVGYAASASAEPGSGGDPEPVSGGRKLLDAQLAKLAPWLDQNQRDFLVLVARGESGFSIGAKNDSAGEAAAAKRAWERHRDYFDTCPTPASGWQFGSGGWFGLLPANPAWHLRNAFGCLDPVYVFDPVMSILGAIAFARALQGYDSFKANPTAATLRAGWANPGWMKSGPPEGRIERWTKHAQSAGLPPVFLNHVIKRFPGNYAQLEAALREGGVA